MNPKVRLHVGHQQSQFWLILAFFVYYYSLFWGPGVISMINEPGGAFTCRSSTLTFLGPWSYFHDQRTLGYVYVSVINTHRFRVPGDFYSCLTPRCAYISFINTHRLADSDLFHGLLLIVLG